MVGPPQIPFGPQSELEFSKLCQILPKSTEFSQDWAKFAEIWLDLEEIRPDLNEISLDLNKI